MRTSIFLLLFCSFSLMAKNANSQNAKVTINKQDVRLESILSEIESQTNYLFIYKKCRCKFAQKHQREGQTGF